MSNSKVRRWFGKNDESQEDYFTRGTNGRMKIQWQKPHEIKDNNKELWKNNTLGKNFESTIKQRDYNNKNKHRSLPVQPRERDVNVDPRRFAMIDPFDFNNNLNLDNDNLDPVTLIVRELQKSERLSQQNISNDQSLQPVRRDDNRTSNYDKELPQTPGQNSSAYNNEIPPPLIPPKMSSREVSSHSSYSTFNEKPQRPKRSSRESSSYSSYSTLNNNNNERPFPSRRSSEQNVLALVSSHPNTNTFNNSNSNERPFPSRRSSEQNVLALASSHPNTNTFNNSNSNERPFPSRRSSEQNVLALVSSHPNTNTFNNNNERPLPSRRSSELNVLVSSHPNTNMFNNSNSNERPFPPKSSPTEQNAAASYSSYSNTPLPPRRTSREMPSYERPIPPRRASREVAPQKTKQSYSSYSMLNNNNNNNNNNEMFFPKNSPSTEQSYSTNSTSNNNDEKIPPPRTTEQKLYSMSNADNYYYNNNNEPPRRTRTISTEQKEISSHSTSNNEITPPPRRSRTISTEQKEITSHSTSNNEIIPPPRRRTISTDQKETNYNNNEKVVPPKTLLTIEEKPVSSSPSMEQEQQESEDSNEKPPLPKKSPSRFQRKIPGTCSTCRKRIIEGGYCTQWCQTCESRNFENNFGTWTSGNDVVDSLVLESQLNAKSRFDYLEWIPFDRFKDVRLIGSGGFGSVYQAIWLDGPKEKWDKKARQYVHCGEWRVALRSFDNSEQVKDNFFNELKEHLQCENNSGNYVIRCYGITQDSKTKDFMLVVQYARNGDLRKYLNKNSAGITWKRRLDILYGVATTLTRIHKENIIHKNLHSGNVLINSYMTLISDLGLSQRADNFNMTNGTFGVLPYVAPEILRAKPYTTAVDVYSFGTIMWEMAFGRKPFSDRAHDEELATNIVNGLQPEIIEEIPECYLELMKSCWNLDPFKRPSAEKLYTTLGGWLCRVYNLSSSDIKVQFSKAEQRRLESVKKGTKSSSAPDQIESPIESPTESPTYPPSEFNNNNFEHSKANFKSRFLKFESLQEPTIIFTRTYNPNEHLAVQEYIAAENETYNVKYEMIQADNTEVAAEIYEILQYW